MINYKESTYTCVIRYVCLGRLVQIMVDWKDLMLLKYCNHCIGIKVIIKLIIKTEMMNKIIYRYQYRIDLNTYMIGKEYLK